jgi:hypothetical protein
MSVEPQWWGFSKEHGWVVLDRDLPCNSPGLNPNLLFFRCRDSRTFVLKRELWRLPAYQFAPNYLRELRGSAAEEAHRELDDMMLRWPEFRAELQQQYKATAEQEEQTELRELKQQTKTVAEARKAREALKVFNGTAEIED